MPYYEVFLKQPRGNGENGYRKTVMSYYARADGPKAAARIVAERLRGDSWAQASRTKVDTRRVVRVSPATIRVNVGNSGEPVIGDPDHDFWLLKE